MGDETPAPAAEVRGRMEQVFTRLVACKAK